MKIEYVAPVLLSNCVEFLKLRAKGSKYYPEDNTWFLDPKMMARIIRYEGNFRAEVDGSELLFFSRVVKTLKWMKIVNSSIKKETYEIIPKDEFHTGGILVKKCSKFSMNLEGGNEIVNNPTPEAN